MQALGRKSLYMLASHHGTMPAIFLVNEKIAQLLFAAPSRVCCVQYPACHLSVLMLNGTIVQLLFAAPSRICCLQYGAYHLSMLMRRLYCFCLLLKAGSSVYETHVSTPRKLLQSSKVESMNFIYSSKCQDMPNGINPAGRGHWCLTRTF